MAIGGPRALPPQRGAVHRSSTPRVLSVLQRPYWSPPPRSFLPILVVAVVTIFHGPRSIGMHRALALPTIRSFSSSLIFFPFHFLAHWKCSAILLRIETLGRFRKETSLPRFPLIYIRVYDHKKISGQKNNMIELSFMAIFVSCWKIMTYIILRI